MDKQDLDLPVPQAIHQQASASLGHGITIAQTLSLLREVYSSV